MTGTGYGADPIRVFTRARAREDFAGTVRAASRIAVAVTVAVAVVSDVVACALAVPARGWLNFPFTGLPANAGEALSIFAHNLRALLGVVGLLLIAQAPLHSGIPRARGQRVLRTAGELLIGGVAAASVVVLGAGLGAYGARMARAILPHAPIELAAYALALALYEQGRNRALRVAHLLAVLATSVALLAAAAGLETFAAL